MALEGDAEALDEAVARYESNKELFNRLFDGKSAVECAVGRSISLNSYPNSKVMSGQALLTIITHVHTCSSLMMPTCCRNPRPAC